PRNLPNAAVFARREASGSGGRADRHLPPTGRRSAMADRRSFTSLIAAAALGSAGMVAGCNTIDGMGRDVTATGDWISDVTDTSEGPAETRESPAGSSATSPS